MQAVGEILFGCSNRCTLIVSERCWRLRLLTHKRAHRHHRSSEFMQFVMPKQLLPISLQHRCSSTWCWAFQPLFYVWSWYVHAKVFERSPFPCYVGGRCSSQNDSGPYVDHRHRSMWLFSSCSTLLIPVASSYHTSWILSSMLSLLWEDCLCSHDHIRYLENKLAIQLARLLKFKKLTAKDLEELEKFLNPDPAPKKKDSAQEEQDLDSGSIGLVGSFL